VDRDGEHLTSEQIKRFLHAACGEPSFRACDIKADSALTAVAKRKLRNLDAPIEVAHRTNQLTNLNLVAAIANSLDPRLKPCLDRLDDIIEAEAVVQVLFWRPTDFSINNTVIGQVLHKLASNPF
jgi:hypothetical protein